MDPKLNFVAHINAKCATARKGIGLLKQVGSYLPVKSLDQIFKMHIRPHLDYCHFIFHILALSNNFNHDINLNYQMRTLESIQYQAALAVSGAWKGTSRDKIYNELGWESLHNRREFRRMTQFYKIMNDLTPPYLREPVPEPRRLLFGSRSTNVLPLIPCKTDRYSNSFYPDAVTSWNNIGVELRSIQSLHLFKSALLKMIRPNKRAIFDIHNPDGIKRIYQLRVGLSPLRAHMKAHHFKDINDNTCACNGGAETTTHFLLVCPFFTVQRNELIGIVSEILKNFTDLTIINQVDFLLYGLSSLNKFQNHDILNATLSYMKKTRRFNNEVLSD